MLSGSPVIDFDHMVVSALNLFSNRVVLVRVSGVAFFGIEELLSLC